MTLLNVNPMGGNMRDTRSVSLTMPTRANTNFPENHFRIVLLLPGTPEWVVAHPGPHSKAREFADLLITLPIHALVQAEFGDIKLTKIQDGGTRFTVVEYIENQEGEEE
jgi:hypothetical protein